LTLCRAMNNVGRTRTLHAQSPVRVYVQIKNSFVNNWLKLSATKHIFAVSSPNSPAPTETNPKRHLTQCSNTTISVLLRMNSGILVHSFEAIQVIQQPRCGLTLSNENNPKSHCLGRIFYQSSKSIFFLVSYQHYGTRTRVQAIVMP
jgi:hypothetical protein